MVYAVCVVMQPPFVYSRASDAYMYGVLLWELFEAAPGELPWGATHNRSTVADSLLTRGTVRTSVSWLIRTHIVLHGVACLRCVSVIVYLDFVSVQAKACRLESVRIRSYQASCATVCLWYA